MLFHPQLISTEGRPAYVGLSSTPQYVPVVSRAFGGSSISSDNDTFNSNQVGLTNISSNSHIVGNESIGNRTAYGAPSNIKNDILSRTIKNTMNAENNDSNNGGPKLIDTGGGSSVNPLNMTYHGNMHSNFVHGGVFPSINGFYPSSGIIMEPGNAGNVYSIARTSTSNHNMLSNNMTLNVPNLVYTSNVAPPSLMLPIAMPQRSHQNSVPVYNNTVFSLQPSIQNGFATADPRISLFNPQIKTVDTTNRHPVSNDEYSLPVNITVKPSKFLSIRLIGDVVGKDIRLGNFLGEGGALRFYLLGEQIKHTFKFMSKSEWQAEKRLINNTISSIIAPPILIHDNFPLFEVVPTLRYLSKKLGQYGFDHMKDFVVDAVSWNLMEWRKFLDKAIYTIAIQSDDVNDSDFLLSYIQERGEFYKKFEELLDVHVKSQRETQLQQLIQEQNDKMSHNEANIKYFTGSSPLFCDYILFSILFDDQKVIGSINMVKNRATKATGVKQVDNYENEYEIDDHNNLANNVDSENGNGYSNDSLSNHNDCSETENGTLYNYLNHCPRLLALYSAIMMHPNIAEFVREFEGDSVLVTDDDFKNVQGNVKAVQNSCTKSESEGRELLGPSIVDGLGLEYSNLNINNTLPSSLMTLENKNLSATHQGVVGSYLPLGNQLHYPGGKFKSHFFDANSEIDPLNITYSGSRSPGYYVFYNPSFIPPALPSTNYFVSPYQQLGMFNPDCQIGTPMIQRSQLYAINPRAIMPRQRPKNSQNNSSTPNPLFKYQVWKMTPNNYSRDENLTNVPVVTTTTCTTQNDDNPVPNVH